MGTFKNTEQADKMLYAQITEEKTIVGAKQIRKSVISGTALRVYLAENADPAITEPIEALCRSNQIECIWVRSKVDLGRACGIEVAASAAAAIK